LKDIRGCCVCFRVCFNFISCQNFCQSWRE